MIPQAIEEQYRAYLHEHRLPLLEIGGREIATATFTPDLLRLLDLVDFTGETISLPQRERIAQALRELRLDFPRAYRCILDGTQVIAKIATSTRQMISSATYLEFLGCTFISDWAFRCIPPGTVLPENQLYCIQENLYHESLHQKLYVYIEEQSIFSDRTVDHGSVHVPWHDVRWPLEQAIHAFFVYRNVLPMRRRAAGDERHALPVRRRLSKAEEAARSSIDALGERISEITATSTPAVRGLWSAMIGDGEFLVGGNA